MIENIYKKISLEPMKSRVCGSVKWVTFDKECEEKDPSPYDGNYGKIPFDIEIPQGIAIKISKQTDINVCVPIDKNDISKGFFNTIVYRNGNYASLSANPNPSEKVLYLTWTGGENNRTVLYRWNRDAGVYTRATYLTHRSAMLWFDFFQEYRKGLLKSDNTFYENYMEIYERLVLTNPGLSPEEYQDKDEEFEAYGGKSMYNFLSTNCFQIKEVIVNNKLKFMPLGVLIDRIEWLSQRYSNYSGLTKYDCANMQDCCDCKEYFDLGGNDFLESYSAITADMSSHKYETNVATFAIPISLHSTDSILGELTPLTFPWEENREYNNGNVVEYDGKNYIFSGEGTGYSNDMEHSEFIFGNLNPDTWDERTRSYSEYQEGLKVWKDMALRNSQEPMRGTTPPSPTGVSSDIEYIMGKMPSQLETMKDTKLLVDNRGNTYQCVARENFNGIPEPNQLFDIPYLRGNFYPYELLDETIVSPNITERTYHGNFLDILGTKFRVLNSNGEIIYTNRFGSLGSSLDAILDCQNYINTQSQEQPGVLFDWRIWFNPKYFVGCHFMIREIRQSYDSYYYQWFVTDDGYNITCTEMIPLTKVSVPFYISKESTIPITYYQLEPIMETLYGEDGEYKTQLCNFEFKSDNFECEVPTFREETRFGLSSKSKIKNEVYVDRGYSSPIELSLKLCECKSIDAMEKYGNGFFNEQ